jgi:hypothetical protein
LLSCNKGAPEHDPQDDRALPISRRAIKHFQ